MSKYNHNGVDISFNADAGKFTFFANGAHYESASLAAAKKRIEKLNTFQQFDALIPGDRWNKKHFVELRIVGVKKTKTSKFGGINPSWVTEAGQTHRAVLLDTPENRALLTEEFGMHRRHEQESEALKEKHMLERREIAVKMKTLSPPVE